MRWLVGGSVAVFVALGVLAAALGVATGDDAPGGSRAFDAPSQGA